MTIWAPVLSSRKPWLLQMSVLIHANAFLQTASTRAGEHCVSLAATDSSLTTYRRGSALTQQFTQRTGVQIQEMQSPENTFDQLDLSRKLLKPDASV